MQIITESYYNDGGTERVRFIVKQGDSKRPLHSNLELVNQKLGNYMKMLKERNLAEVQLAVANAHIEILLGELQKKEKLHYDRVKALIIEVAELKEEKGKLRDNIRADIEL